MKLDLEKLIASACEELFSKNIKVELTRPDEQFGDYSTNAALILAKELGVNPREVADKLAQYIRSESGYLSKVDVAGPGFINFTLSDACLIESLAVKPEQTYLGMQVVTEYSDPNPFKVLHAGHLYTTIVGDAIANLIQAAGGDVHRVNYGGDVGLHVAKTLWAIIDEFGGEKPDMLDSIKPDDRSNWLAEAYVRGNNTYETAHETTTDEIKRLNKRVYELHTEGDHESNLAVIYWTCRRWSYEAFDAFYARLGTKMEKYYPESEVVEKGLELVQQRIGSVFKESEGAIVFAGEEYDLHTRVFINREGLPTYETKEIGLIVKKYEDYHFDRSVVITANEQSQYMAVVYKAIEQFLPKLVEASIYIPHGMVKLAGGTKMSSRKGNIVRASEVLDTTAEASRELVGKQDDVTTLGAVKYAFLKSRLGSDIIYDSKESVSIEGNSGPYLQYAHARACSILKKASRAGFKALDRDANLELGERSIVLKLSQYAEILDKSVAELMPHHVCTYLYELCQVFNRFYEGNRVLGDPRQPLRLTLVELYASTLKAGLQLLNIDAPDHL